MPFGVHVSRCFSDMQDWTVKAEEFFTSVAGFDVRICNELMFVGILGCSPQRCRRMQLWNMVIN
jgi:hypothetical protein